MSGKRGDRESISATQVPKSRKLHDGPVIPKWAEKGLQDFAHFLKNDELAMHKAGCADLTWDITDWEGKDPPKPGRKGQAEPWRQGEC